MGDANRTFQCESVALRQGRLVQFRYYVANLAATGVTDWIELPATALSLILRLCPAQATPDTNMNLLSAVDAWVWVQLNHDSAPWLRWSLIPSSQDVNSVVCTITRFRVRNTVAAGRVLVFLAQYSADVGSSVGGVTTSGGFGTSGASAG
jgi:hypothetical protein